MDADHAGVKFPPPFVYAAAVVAGWLLNRAWPLRVSSGGWPRAAVAWLCVAAWTALFAASFGSFLRRRTTLIPNRPATALVVRGPYRFTRNPMYVSLAFLTAGVGLFMNTWWPLLLLVPTLFVIRFAVIAPEEAYLRRRFGVEYDEYTRKVRRWL